MRWILILSSFCLFSMNDLSTPSDFTWFVDIKGNKTVCLKTPKVQIKNNAESIKMEINLSTKVEESNDFMSSKEGFFSCRDNKNSDQTLEFAVNYKNNSKQYIGEVKPKEGDWTCKLLNDNTLKHCGVHFSQSKSKLAENDGKVPLYAFVLGGLMILLIIVVLVVGCYLWISRRQKANSKNKSTCVSQEIEQIIEQSDLRDVKEPIQINIKCYIKKDEDEPKSNHQKGTFNNRSMKNRPLPPKPFEPTIKELPYSATYGKNSSASNQSQIYLENSQKFQTVGSSFLENSSNNKSKANVRPHVADLNTLMKVTDKILTVKRTPIFPPKNLNNLLKNENNLLKNESNLLKNDNYLPEAANNLPPAAYASTNVVEPEIYDRPRSLHEFQKEHNSGDFSDSFSDDSDASEPPQNPLLLQWKEALQRKNGSATPPKTLPKPKSHSIKKETPEFYTLQRWEIPKPTRKAPPPPAQIIRQKIESPYEM